MRTLFDPRPFCALALLATSVACGTIVLPSEESSGEETSDGDSDSSSTAVHDEPGSSGDESTSTGEPPGGFVDNPDVVVGAYECDTWAQDCPAGHKCTFWASDGGSSWNATRCVEIVPDADEIGEPCTVEGSGTTGLDTCVLGAMCWDVDPDTNEGECIEFCTGSESNPFCSDPSMICAGRGPFLCLPTCCPLEQDCAEGEACYPVNDTFWCAPDAGGEMGAFGDPCEYINVCDPGLLCADSSLNPECDGSSSGCCTAFCEVGSDSCSLLHPDLECTPWYEADQAPPGSEHIGACTSVQ